MAAKVICMASAKGGSGKTALTATFGTFLAALGKNVLLVDTDGATNGLTLFYLKEVTAHGESATAETREPLGIYECDHPEKAPEIVPLPSGMSLLPATFKFQDTETTNPDAFKGCLRHRLLVLRDSFDYIFLDAQAGSDWSARAAMSRDVSDEVVIVSEYDPMSAAGVERLKALLRDDLTFVRTWILLNKMLPEFVKSFSEFLEIAKYLSPIPWDADVVRAYARRSLAVDLEHGNEHTLAVLQTLRALLGKEISTELEAWTVDKAAVIRQPLDIQYEDVQRELEALTMEKYWTARRQMQQLVLDSARAFAVTAGPVLALTLGMTLYGLLRVPLESLCLISLAAGAIGLAVAVARHYLRPAYAPPGEYLKRAQLQNRLDLLMARLSKLEVLRHSDLETVIKSRRRPGAKDL